MYLWNINLYFLCVRKQCLHPGSQARQWLAFRDRSVEWTCSHFISTSCGWQKAWLFAAAVPVVQFLLESRFYTKSSPRPPKKTLKSGVKCESWSPHLDRGVCWRDRKGALGSWLCVCLPDKQGSIHGAQKSFHGPLRWFSLTQSLKTGQILKAVS